MVHRCHLQEMWRGVLDREIFGEGLWRAQVEREMVMNCLSSFVMGVEKELSHWISYLGRNHVHILQHRTYYRREEIRKEGMSLQMRYESEKFIEWHKHHDKLAVSLRIYLNDSFFSLWFWCEGRRFLGMGNLDREIDSDFLLVSNVVTISSICAHLTVDDGNTDKLEDLGSYTLPFQSTPSGHKDSLWRKRFNVC